MDDIKKILDDFFTSKYISQIYTHELTAEEVEDDFLYHCKKYQIEVTENLLTKMYQIENGI